ncbi:MAG: DHHA1 domain-containing protein, partial [Planctomycetaceae bacterium]
VEDLLSSASVTDGVRVIVRQVGCDIASMRQLIDQVRRKASPVAILLAGLEDQKVTLVAGISHELEQRGFSASEWLKEPAAMVGGKGGGRKDLAQAGGRLPEAIPTALATALESMQRQLGP